jgi:hypothetical protein
LAGGRLDDGFDGVRVAVVFTLGVVAGAGEVGGLVPVVATCDEEAPGFGLVIPVAGLAVSVGWECHDDDHDQQSKQRPKLAPTMMAVRRHNVARVKLLC